MDGAFSIVKDILRAGVAGPADVLNYIYRSLRLIIFLLLTISLYKVIVGDFSFANSFEDVFNFFMTGYFIKPILVFLLSFILFEVVLNILLGMIMGWIFVNRAIKIKRGIETDTQNLDIEERNKYKIQLHEWVNKMMNKMELIISEDFNLPKDKKEILGDVKKARFRNMDEFLIFLTQTYLFFCFIGFHSFGKDLILLILILIFAWLKGSLIVGKKAIKIIDG